MDITEALAPASDQLDAIELVEPRTFTIAPGSKLGKRDGKTVAEIRFENFDRVWRPSKGMLDVLADCWGTKAEHWVGHSVTVYNDPDVMYGKDKVGGVRISHLSHIDKARVVTIRGAGAGRKKPWPVEPLTEPATPTDPTPAQIADATTPDELMALWNTSTKSAAVKAKIAARKAELDATAEEPPSGLAAAKAALHGEQGALA